MPENFQLILADATRIAYTFCKVAWLVVIRQFLQKDSLKGEEDDKLILGAFSMMDYYVYFDRLDKQVKVYEENCYLRTKQILLKKERILEAIQLSKRLGNKNALFLSIIGVASCAYLLFSRKKKIN